MFTAGNGEESWGKLPRKPAGIEGKGPTKDVVERGRASELGLAGMAAAVPFCLPLESEACSSNPPV